ncbi:ribosome biogenesis GTP-binding protein YihA/YsxC [bacterium]|nr:ribosome biogenesis GTP-binding protein YihA/YsxC [bacterium]
MNYEIQFSHPVFTLRDLPASGLPELCISGRSNAGKSSLINRLANKKNLAKVSQKPGKTRSLNFYSVRAGFYLVDLPGYGYAKVPKSEQNLFSELVGPYLDNRRELRGIIQLIDSRHGPVSGDLAMLEWIRARDVHALFVFAKIDKLNSRELVMLKKTSEKEFGVENCAFFSARTGTGADTIMMWIERTLGIDEK